MSVSRALEWRNECYSNLGTYMNGQDYLAHYEIVQYSEYRKSTFDELNHRALLR